MCYRGKEEKGLTRIMNITEMKKQKIDITIQVLRARVALLRLKPGVYVGVTVLSELSDVPPS